ncbi:hypothetical protein RRF57_012669 [Xylaria bambusicola]|uniref:Uncharacterized protein n=1 Tax=Xylaria bambusicola TaxID=326684 RepID=A0AAN7UVK4_9PEZI
MTKERMITHLRCAICALPSLNKRLVPVLDASAALAGGDKPVKYHANIRAHINGKARHLEGATGVRKGVPTQVIEPAEEQEATSSQTPPYKYTSGSRTRSELCGPT